MTRGRKIAVAALTAASPVVAWAVARLMDHGPEDLGAFYYFLVLTPLGTAVVSALLLGRAPGRHAGWTAGVVVAVLAAEGAFHAASVRLGWMPGSYVLPAGLPVERMSIAGLRAVLRGRNQAIAFAALQELGRRGADGADALFEELQAEGARLGVRYMDTELVHFAVSRLCEAGDPRVAEFVGEISDTPRASKRLITVRCGRW